MYSIFISHASANRQLACKVKTLLERALCEIPKLTVFCSSCDGDIKGGKKWFDEIMRNLKESSACVAIMTPESVFFSPWVAYECGGAYLRFEITPECSRLFPVCARGMTPGTLPSPFNAMQARCLDDPAQVKLLCREVAEVFSVKSSKKPTSLIRAVVTEAAKGSRGWELVHTTLIGQRQESSPFSIDTVIGQASTEVFCAGFNLNYVSSSPTIKKAVFRFLKDSPKRSVRLLISDPAHRKLLAGWKLVGETYLDDLNRSVKNFRKWLEDAKKQKLKGHLEIKLAHFVALTITCIDPKLADGQMVVVPSVPKKPHSADRPQVWLSKRHHSPEFSYYWVAYEDLFRYARDLDASV